MIGRLLSLSLRKQLESVDVSRPNYREVPPIQSRNCRDFQPLGSSHNRSIDCTEWQIAMSRHQFGDPQPVSRPHWLSNEGAGGEIAQKAHFGLSSESNFEQIGNLRHDKLRNNEWARMRLQYIKTARVVSVILIDVGI